MPFLTLLFNFVILGGNFNLCCMIVSPFDSPKYDLNFSTLLMDDSE
jgi:hypothetical protein